MTTIDKTVQSSQTPSNNREVLLRVEGLCTSFHLAEGIARAVDNVSFEVCRSRTLGVVGESGCGKSVTALSIMGLVPSPPGRIESGRIVFDGQDLLLLDDNAMRRLRGDRISMIFQEPMTALNPVFTVGAQVAEILLLHRDISRKDAMDQAVEMLDKVRIPSARNRANDYPHQMSGGMRQRAMIAMALACDPDLLIADEPTTALDVTVQAQILDLMADLQESTQTAIQLITHDLGVVAETAHDVVVMYAGQIVESGPSEKIFARPGHPYTEGLMASIPKFSEIREGKELETIPGLVPNPTEWPHGCRFAPRCLYAREECRKHPVDLEVFENGHESRCLFSKELFG